jgi:hypothetical protein
MSRAGQQAFGALTEYFLGRLQARTQMEFEGKARAEEDERRKQLWREEQAAKGEERGVVTRLNGGQAMEMDIGRYFDKDSGEFKERVYGARPVSTEPKRSGSDFSRIVMADGSHANHPRDEPLPPGARFYDAAAERPKSGGGGRSSAPREPKRVWIDRGGESLLVSEAEVQKGDRPLDNTAAGRKRAEGREMVGNAWRSLGEAVAAPVRTIAGLVTGGRGGDQQPARAEQQGPQLSAGAAQTLAEVQDAINSGADRNAVIARLNPKDPDDAAVLALLRGRP